MLTHDEKFRVTATGHGLRIADVATGKDVFLQLSLDQMSKLTGAMSVKDHRKMLDYGSDKFKVSPRALGTNPRALGINPKAERTDPELCKMKKRLLLFIKANRKSWMEIFGTGKPANRDIVKARISDCTFAEADLHQVFKVTG